MKTCNYNKVAESCTQIKGFLNAIGNFMDKCTKVVIPKGFQIPYLFKVATALYFYGSILLRALKYKITVILTYAQKNIVDLVIM